MRPARKRSQKRAVIAPTALDLFSGCGGLTLGLKQAGFKVIGAVELDQTAVNSYRSNHADVHLKHVDIRKLSAEGLRRELRIPRGQLDLLAGCPPCQGFSSLRTRNGSKRNRDARNSLVGEMLRFARAFLPRTIMIENVPGLARYAPFGELCQSLSALGYRIGFAIKDAADYGVPQRRRRLILLAGRNFQVPFARESTRYRTVRDAIGGMVKAGDGDTLHNLPEKRSKKVLGLIRDIPKNGGSRSDLPKSRQLACHKRTNGFKDIYGRMSWDGLAPTITSGCFNPSKGRFLHPEKNRAVSMREAALLQSFPLNYVFDVSKGKQAVALMIGNALPPEFIRRHAIEIRGALERNRAVAAKT